MLTLKGPYLGLEKEHFCVVFTYSIERAREIRKFMLPLCNDCYKMCEKHDARSKLLFAN